MHRGHGNVTTLQRFGALIGISLALIGCEAGTPAPISGELSQAALIAEVATWLTLNPDVELQPVVYVLEELPTEYRGFEGADAAPDEGAGPLASAGSSLFAGELEESTKGQLRTILGGDRELRFTPTVEAALDTDAQEMMGCYPYLDDATLVMFAAPRPASADGGGGYFMTASVAHNCGGAEFLVKLVPTSDGYEVEVVNSYQWIV